MSPKNKLIVLGVTGSIAAYKAGDIIRRLREQGFRVSVIMTKDAEQFVTPLMLATLSGDKVYRKMFDQRQSDWQIGHVSLAREASAILIAPATANVIGKIAAGLADDLLTCTVMATQAPVYIVPAMNTFMYRNAIVQENCQKLKKLGYRWIGPESGRLACGEEGDGRLAAIDDIVSILTQEVL